MCRTCCVSCKLRVWPEAVIGPIKAVYQALLRFRHILQRQDLTAYRELGKEKSLVIPYSL